MALARFLFQSQHTVIILICIVLLVVLIQSANNISLNLTDSPLSQSRELAEMR